MYICKLFNRCPSKVFCKKKQIFPRLVFGQKYGVCNIDVLIQSLALNRLYATGTLSSDSSPPSYVDIPILAKVPFNNSANNDNIENQLFSSKSFTDLGVSSDLLENLKRISGISRPTLIQDLAFEVIYERRHPEIVLADQTGSGKTLAYLLPLLKLIKDKEMDKGSNAQAGRPLVLILVPTRELALQVGEIIKFLSHFYKIKSDVLASSMSLKKQKETLLKTLDFLVSTPGCFLKNLESQRVYLSKVQHIVIDEADTMLQKESGFDVEVNKVLNPIRNRRTKDASQYSPQFIYVGATITQKFFQIIYDTIPDFKLVTSNKLHKPALKLKQYWIDVSGNKLNHFLSLLKGKIPNSESVIIFCNSISSCRYLEHTLNEKGFNAIGYHGRIPIKLRSKNFDQFKSKSARILVCTDIASRGLDFPHTKHIIIFDFPLNSVDYIHRIGRTARGGQEGNVYNFVLKKDRVLANAIKMALNSKSGLDGITSSISTNLSHYFSSENKVSKTSATKSNTIQNIDSSNRFFKSDPLRKRKHKRVGLTKIPPKPDSQKGYPGKDSQESNAESINTSPGNLVLKNKKARFGDRALKLNPNILKLKNTSLSSGKIVKNI